MASSTHSYGCLSCTMGTICIEAFTINLCIQLNFSSLYNSIKVQGAMDMWEYFIDRTGQFKYQRPFYFTFFNLQLKQFSTAFVVSIQYARHLRLCTAMYKAFCSQCF